MVVSGVAGGAEGHVSLTECVGVLVAEMHDRSSVPVGAVEFVSSGGVVVTVPLVVYLLGANAVAEVSFGPTGFSSVWVAVLVDEFRH